MILNSECAALRNEAGEIEESWVTWTEAREFSEAVIDKFSEWALLAAFGAASVGSVYASAIGAERLLPGAIVSSILLFGLGWYLMRLRWRVPGHARVLSFHRNGGILLPWGLSPMRSSRDRLSLPHTQIASIEAEQVVFPKGDDATVYTHGVRLVFRQGQIAHIAQRLHADHAHLIAVRLTQALIELREEMANAATAATTAPPQARHAAPRRRERVIN